MSLVGGPDESQETMHGFQTVALRRGKLDGPRQFRHAFDGGILVVQLREKARDFTAQFVVGVTLGNAGLPYMVSAPVQDRPARNRGE